MGVAAADLAACWSVQLRESWRPGAWHLWTAYTSLRGFLRPASSCMLSGMLPWSAISNSGRSKAHLSCQLVDASILGPGLAGLLQQLQDVVGHGRQLLLSRGWLACLQVVRLLTPRQRSGELACATSTDMTP